MSQIDAYTHECIGIVTCPADYEIVQGNNLHRNIPLYRLDEAVIDWGAKAGDLLLGGGDGESAPLRIAIPEAIYFLTGFDWDDFDSHDELWCAYWLPTEAYVFGNGYVKLGRSPNDKLLERWLVGHLIAFITQTYPEIYRRFCDKEILAEDGRICRLQTLEEKQVW